MPGFGGLELTTSSTALQALTDAVLYLVAYPFECAEQLSSRVGCRVAPGFSDRVIFRELFPHGLTMLDLPVKGFPMPLTMSHIAARQEVRELLTMLRLPGLEKATTGG